MKSPKNNDETIKAFIAWLEGYPKFKGVMALYDASDGTITDLANGVEPHEVLMFTNAYKTMVENILGVTPMPVYGVPPGMVPFGAIPDEDIELHTESHTCPCSVAELEDIKQYIEQPGHTLAGLTEMVNHRLKIAKGDE